jgi:uncharacterized protein
MFRKLLWLLAPLALLSCHAKAPQSDADPALWVVRDRDTTIYLFGSVHALRPGLTWFDEAVKNAFDHSRELVVEVVMPPQAETAEMLREMGELPAGTRLSQQLPPELANRVRESLKRAGQREDMVEKYEPWLAAIQLAVLPNRAEGYDSAYGVESVLTAAAKKSKKKISGLETPRQQFGYFDTLSPAAQQVLLGETLDSMTTAGTTMDRIVTAWGNGDTESLAALMNEDLSKSPELTQALLIQRNRNWAGWVAARLRKPGVVFVAVGAGHLAGDNSLQRELQRRGLTVTRIRY